jgi:hypothetical protein
MPRIVRNGNFRKYKPMSHKPKTGKPKPPLKTVTVAVQIISNPESSIRVFSNGDQTGEVIANCRIVGSVPSSKYRIRADKYELLQPVQELQVGDTVTVSGTLHQISVAGRSYSEIRVQSLEHTSVQNTLLDAEQHQNLDE